MPPVQCQNCGLVVQVPAGGRRLCGCGSWLSSDEPLAVAEVAQIAQDAHALPVAERWPRLEGDLSAVERLNNGYRRIQKELNKAIVGQQRVLEELIIAVFARGHCLLVGVPGLAKTQAALLEAMQERQVTVGGARHRLPDPFFVLATQNPIEQEGTYPLPEAQQDRFMFNIHVDYPEEEEEFKIVEMTTSIHQPKVERVLSATDILEMQDIVRKVPVAPYVIRYAMKFTRLTRKDKEEVP